MQGPEVLRGIAVEVHHVGSCATCNPPPVGTDCDWLAFVPTPMWSEFMSAMTRGGWEFGGSVIDDDVNYIPAELRFVSFKLGEDNIIATSSRFFFDRFLAATSVAKRLNLLQKDDRIALFQAVLYGNPNP